MIQLQNAFMHLINGEKYFNNLLFLSMKSISKLSVKMSSENELLTGFKIVFLILKG